MGGSAGSEPAAPARGLVLVVEDEAHIAELVRMYLARDGFGVHVERDGEAGLAAARSLSPVAIVLDIRLPGLDGTELCRRLRAEGDWTPVLFVTARDDEVDRIVGLELGAEDYVTKPFSPRERRAALHVRTVWAERCARNGVEFRLEAPRLLPAVDHAVRREVRRAGARDEHPITVVYGGDGGCGPLAIGSDAHLGVLGDGEGLARLVRRLDGNGCG